jgi:acetyl esterase/lipase
MAGVLVVEDLPMPEARRSQPGRNLAVNQPMRPVVRRYGPDPAQFGELWLPSVPPAATVVIVHGGFWRARYHLSLGRPLAADLVRRGYAVWNLEYRRVGAAGGWAPQAHESAAVLSVLYGAVLVPLAMLASLALLRAERKERKNS